MSIYTFTMSWKTFTVSMDTCIMSYETCSMSIDTFTMPCGAFTMSTYAFNISWGTFAMYMGMYTISWATYCVYEDIYNVLSALSMTSKTYIMHIENYILYILVIARHGLGKFVNVYSCALLGHAFTHKLNGSCNLCRSVVCSHQIWRESVQK
jgi:hypothetical protein